MNSSERTLFVEQIATVVALGCGKKVDAMWHVPHTNTAYDYSCTGHTITVQCIYCCCSVYLLLLYSVPTIAVQCTYYCCTVYLLLLYRVLILLLYSVPTLLYSVPTIAVQCTYYCCTVDKQFNLLTNLSISGNS